MKYKLTDITKDISEGKPLYRIQALKDFRDVKKGDLGGWVESEKNLSQEGNCWIAQDAQVTNDAIVYGNALISGTAQVCDRARVGENAAILNTACLYSRAFVCGTACVRDNAHIFGDARVCGDAVVSGDAHISGEAHIYGNTFVRGSANIQGKAKVYRNARVEDRAFISGYATVHGGAIVGGRACVTDRAEVAGSAIIHDSRLVCDAAVYNRNHLLDVTNIGSRRDTTTFFLSKDKSIWVSCGCFSGSLEDFKEEVLRVHGSTKYGKEYKAAINLAKIVLGKGTDGR